MANRFETLNEALESEGLVSFWPLGLNIGYDETKSTISGGRYITVTRFENGQYERPVHYATKLGDE